MAEPISIPAHDIEALIAQFEASGCSELHVRVDGFELHLSNDATARIVEGASAVPPSRATASVTPPPIPAPGIPDADDLDGFEIVRAPYLGTFYRAPKPGEPVYVDIGADVIAESELCLVEVMKLFTAVRAGVAGTIARVLVADGAMVEAGQPLFAIDGRG